MRWSEQHWVSAVFPLLLLLSLAALTFWLKRAVEMPAAPPSGKNRHDPDYIVHDLTAKKIDAKGMLRFQLVADEMRHYPDDDTTDVFMPQLLMLSQDRPSITATSKRGKVFGQGDKVILEENVVIIREPSPEKAAIEARMPDLTVLPDDEVAFTASPVDMIQGKSTLKGIGMHIDQLNQTYVLNNQVSGIIERDVRKESDGRKK